MLFEVDCSARSQRKRSKKKVAGLKNDPKKPISVAPNHLLTPFLLAEALWLNWKAHLIDYLYAAGELILFAQFRAEIRAGCLGGKRFLD